MLEQNTVYTVRGLQKSGEILIDSFGVPHIYTATLYDAFFVQGFNAARDRLWQIDLWRRRGLGLLSEVFGPSFIDRDRAARLFVYRGNMHREWLAYGSDTKRVVTAFVEGVNEYVKLTEENPDLLPAEFAMMGYRPTLWSPEDVPRIRSHGLTKNLTSEVERARTLRDFGPEMEALRSRVEPFREIIVPEGLDLNSIPDDVLRVYELATNPVELNDERSGGSYAGTDMSKSPQEGSNNWVISPDRTATGRPILANDPHREQSVPSLRYIVHLVAPELDVIGAGEPALPGISIGHNGKIAFGLTIFSIDQEDLYIYETNPENSSEYLYEGRWEPMELEKQKISVKAEEPAEVELKYTRHGPVIYEDPEKRIAFAVRAAWLECGMAPYLGSIDYMRAGNWDEFLAAMNRWGAPGENQVYADTKGNIGWKPAGLVPKRPNWDGLLPVPGDGRYEWDGFLDMDELPKELNPSHGWIATANQMNLPADFPYEEKKVGFEWYPPFRYERIAEVLETNRNLTVQDSVALQNDSLSVLARRITASLSTLSSEDLKVARALEMLKEWDCVLSEGSSPAALFEVWYRFYLRKELVARVCTGENMSEAIAAVTRDTFESDVEVGDAMALLELIEKPDGRLGAKPEEARDEAMLSSLRKAVEHLECLLGPDPEAWRWDELHHASLTHPLSSLGDEETRDKLDVGPLPRGGSGETVGMTGYRVEDFRQMKGSSFRVVVDVGNWDASMTMNSPGQSGNVDSSHYADLFAEWARDGAFPLLYDREKVEAATEQRIVLEPQKR